MKITLLSKKLNNGTTIAAFTQRTVNGGAFFWVERTRNGVAIEMVEVASERDAIAEVNALTKPHV